MELNIRKMNFDYNLIHLVQCCIVYYTHVNDLYVHNIIMRVVFMRMRMTMNNNIGFTLGITSCQSTTLRQKKDATTC